MIVAADDVRNLHIRVVDDHTEIVRRRAIRTDDDEIVEFGVVEFDAPPHGVVHNDATAVRIAEADDERLAVRILRALAAATVIAGLLARCHLLGTHRVELVATAVAAVGDTRIEPAGRDIRVALEARALEYRLVVGRQAEPLHAVEDRLDVLRRRAFAIRILDAQDEFATSVARVQPVEKCRANTAEVQDTGRARGESGSDQGGRSATALTN